MIYTNMPRNCVVFFLPRRLTRSAIYGSQIFDSHKWPTVLVRNVTGKLCNFEANLYGSLYSTFTTSFYVIIPQPWGLPPNPEDLRPFPLWTMVVVVHFREATENFLDLRKDPQSSWKYVENMYYMNIQLSPLSLNLSWFNGYPCINLTWYF